MNRAGAVLAMALGLAPAAAQACLLPNGLMMSNGAYTVAAVPDPAPIEIGRHFSLTLTLCADASAVPARIVAIDAQMPAHRHGMNYAPTLTALDGGRVRADGLLLHMPGLWLIGVDIDAAGKRQRLEVELTLE